MIRSTRLRSPSRRTLNRLAADPHVLLALAVVLAALVIELASRGNVVVVVVPSLVYLGVQSVLALTTHIELFVLQHYRESIDKATDLSPLWKDVFLHHAREESQHAILDELEWVRENAKLTSQARDAAVDDLIALVGAVDGILQAQAAADTHYFVETCGRPLNATEVEAVKATILAAYRWQYIVSGVKGYPRFGEILGSLITAEQGERISKALEPILG